MSKVITVRYLGPTNHHMARMRVRSEAKSITVNWDHGLQYDSDNFALAARELALALGWTGTWDGGELPNGDGYAFVLNQATCAFEAGL